ncbi:MAG: glutathione peroxidase [Planctomycetota bacterium]|jgi:glutathione peroxidase
MRRISAVFVGIASGIVALGAIVAYEGRPGPMSDVYAINESALNDDVNSYVLGYEMERLEGGTQKLEEYKGKVVLMVNTASKCGNTPQYEGLQAMYEEYGERGLVILGFPANNFGAQEPGTNFEIAQFCEKNYGVTFPMFAKISVKGDGIHPLYEHLTSMPEPIGGEVRWNFQKYLVDREGNVVMKFDPGITPEDERLVDAVEGALGVSGS